jgi:hypothetical protein
MPKDEGSGLWNVVFCVFSKILKQWEKSKDILVTYHHNDAY